ncbi:hypothetical protein Clacol_007330 [Clathrus columnatus]|uniref:Phosducin domain-containing protein n=1 Tax=Clathrus columnatus TaxID=1419009 RepID=A0AAV5AFL3_9AGAM|nr:hypothetical protein Clacol_007330 [Clathrus columnatus]
MASNSLQDLEERILSGKGFRDSPISSPRHSPFGSRSPSPDPLFPADEDLSDSDISLSQQFGKRFNPNENSSSYIDTPGNGTGVKSVIRDRKEAVRRDQVARGKRIRDINQRLEKMALVATTYAQDEELQVLEKAAEVGLDEREAVIRKQMLEHTGRFGHLREVGPSSFVDAIEGVPKSTWVVLHIYDSTSSRCHNLDTTLAQLARQYQDTKFIRARAGAIGFATLMPTQNSPQSSNFVDNFVKNYEEDEDIEDSDVYENQGSQDEQVDPDLFPTMLIYRGGELIYTWIRVDWEADSWVQRKEGSSMDTPVEALLKGDDGDLETHEEDDDEIFDL